MIIQRNGTTARYGFANTVQHQHPLPHDLYISLTLTALRWFFCVVYDEDKANPGT